MESVAPEVPAGLGSSTRNLTVAGSGPESRLQAQRPLSRAFPTGSPSRGACPHCQLHGAPQSRDPGCLSHSRDSSLSLCPHLCKGDLTGQPWPSRGTPRTAQSGLLSLFTAFSPLSSCPRPLAHPRPSSRPLLSSPRAQMANQGRVSVAVQLQTRPPFLFPGPPGRPGAGCGGGPGGAAVVSAVASTSSLLRGSQGPSCHCPAGP